MQAGNHLLDDLKDLAGNIALHAGKAGHICARSRQVFYEAANIGIGGRGGYDRNGCGHRDGGAYTESTFGHDDIDTLIHQRDGKLGEPGDISVAPLRDKDKVAPLHVSMLSQCAQEGIEFVLRRRSGAQKSNAPHALGLLRARRERPRRR